LLFIAKFFGKYIVFNFLLVSHAFFVNYADYQSQVQVSRAPRGAELYIGGRCRVLGLCFCVVFSSGRYSVEAPKRHAPPTRKNEPVVSQVEKFTTKPRTPQTLNPGFSIETQTATENL